MMKKSHIAFDKWQDEIIRETEHYYQGEMQQEERASWLLGTSSALLAILFSVYFTCFDRNISISKAVIFLIVLFFSISATIALLAILPTTSIKKAILMIFPQNFSKNELFDENLVKQRFKIHNDWTLEEFRIRLFYHFQRHYGRNLCKSKLVIWSSLFLLMGLLISGIYLIIFILSV